MEQTELPALALALLQELQNATEPQSSLRIAKKLGIRQSTLMRCLAYLGEEEVGGVAGPGWVRAEEADGRLLLSITDAGRAAAKAAYEA